MNEKKATDEKKAFSPPQCVQVDLFIPRDDETRQVKKNLIELLNKNPRARKILNPVTLFQIEAGKDVAQRVARSHVLQNTLQAALYESIAMDPRSGMRGTDGDAAYIVRAVTSHETGERGIVLCENGDVFNTHPELNSQNVIWDVIADMGQKLKDSGFPNLFPKPRTSKS